MPGSPRARRRLERGALALAFLAGTAAPAGNEAPDMELLEFLGGGDTKGERPGDPVALLEEMDESAPAPAPPRRAGDTEKRR
jgi:hypothetical protein